MPMTEQTGFPPEPPPFAQQPAPAPDDRDAEIARLKAELAAREGKREPSSSEPSSSEPSSSEPAAKQPEEVPEWLSAAIDAAHPHIAVALEELFKLVTGKGKP
jgi:hypothetical protein